MYHTIVHVESNGRNAFELQVSIIFDVNRHRSTCTRSSPSYRRLFSLAQYLGSPYCDPITSSNHLCSSITRYLPPLLPLLFNILVLVLVLVHPSASDVLLIPFSRSASCTVFRVIKGHPTLRVVFNRASRGSIFVLTPVRACTFDLRKHLTT